MPAAGRESIAETLALGPAFAEAGRSAFTDAMSIAMTVGLAGAAAGAVVALLVLPGERGEKPQSTESEQSVSA